LRKRRASRTRAIGPQNALPAGAPRPFEKQTLTVSNGALSAATSTPSATLAFHRRAPSRLRGEADRARALGDAPRLLEAARRAPAGPVVRILDRDE